MTLTEAMAEYEADQQARTDGHLVTLRRAYMAGALQAAALAQRGEKPADLIAQCVAFGRTVGTGIERAT